MSTPKLREKIPDLETYKRLLAKHGSMDGIAKTLGVSPQTVSRWRLILESIERAKMKIERMYGRDSRG